ncbi:mitochondrial nuclease [Nannochloropsis oceanica]
MAAFFTRARRRSSTIAASIVAGSSSILLTSMLTHDDQDAAGFVAHAQAHQANDLHKWSHVGLPAFDTTYIFRENFVICYDSRTRNPKWVMERLTKQTCTGEADRRVVGFYEEDSIDPRFRSKNSDYLNSGYDRGHMASAANNRSSTQTMQETFSLANVSPQVGGGFNRDYWARVEKFTRDLTKHCDAVYLVSGPLFLPQRRDTIITSTSNTASKAKFIMTYELLGEAPSLVAVPTHFFKCVFAEMRNGRKVVAAFVLPNAPIHADVPLTRFLVPLANLEQAAGFRMFAQALTEEEREEVDARVLGLRGVGAGNGGEEVRIEGMLTNGISDDALVVRRGGREGGGGRGGGGGGGGIKLNLDAPEHLCDVVVCQLPPEKFWQVNGNKKNREKRKNRDDSGGVNAEKGEEWASPGFPSMVPSSWWSGGRTA